MYFKLDHMCSHVRNIHASTSFYRDVLGGQVTSQIEVEKYNFKCVYIQIADGLFELIEPANKDETTIYGLDHVAFTTDDLDGAYKYFSDLGYVFHVPPKPAISGNGRLAFFKDPNGANVEILQRDYDLHREPIQSPIIEGFDHYALTVQDLKVSHKLYHEQLGLENLAYFMIEGQGRELMYLGSGADALEIVHNTMLKGEINPHAHISLRVDCMETACEKLAKHGVKIEGNEIKIPGSKIGKTASIRDLDGVRIELLDRPDLRVLEQRGYTPKTHATMREF